MSVQSLIATRQVKHSPFSFKTARQFRSMVEVLPQPPRWKSKVVNVGTATTKSPLILYYRDALECFKFLFANPLFRGHQDLVPRKVWANKAKTVRIFSDPMTAKKAWAIQVRPNYLRVNFEQSYSLSRQEKSGKAKHWALSCWAPIRRASLTTPATNHATGSTSRAAISTSESERRSLPLPAPG